MALFGRNKTENTDVPADLQQYYTSDRPSIGSMIVRGLALLITLGILIWAGVWLFNKLTNRQPTAQTNQTTTTQQSEVERNATAAKEKAEAEAKKAAEEAKKKAEEAKKQAATTNNNPAPAPTPAPAANPAPTQPPAPASPTPTPTPTPATGTALPNVGPSMPMLAGLFAVTSAIGAALHSLVIRRQHQ